MKKVSISLFAVLAIVFAVASAFTTNSKKLVTEYKYYGLSNQTVAFPSTPSVTTVEAGSLFHTNSSNITIDQALINSAPDDGCLDDAGWMCSAEVFNNNGTKSITETKEGDFFTN
jgi:hypothetical protein